ncbi:MAG TPA: polyprenyl synthetase family protein [Pyrinomonadaceae bacterium]
MSEQLASFVASRRGTVEEALWRGLPFSSLPRAGRLNEALEYAVFPGGKRLRPALSLLASELAGATREQGLAAACAVEFLHSSSLILDDLPSMDDAGLRRKRPALHLVYGEGVAVLAAVALLNQSYSLLADAARGRKGSGSCVSLVREAARCVGSDGMAGGQAVDLLTRAGDADAQALACRELKTVALMRLMMTAGALAVGAGAGDTRSLADFGECFGRAYQLCDDVQDETQACETTGKPARQDARHLRASAVVGLGTDGARELARKLVTRGVARLYEQFGARDEVMLLADAAYLVLDASAESSPEAGVRPARENPAREKPARENEAARARESVAG